MKCPFCKEWKGNKVRGYPVKDQLYRHIEIKHPETLSTVKAS